MTVSKPPICIYCSHVLPKRDNLMSCRAFEMIPRGIVFNRLDHRLPVIGDNGIRFEQDPERPLLDHEAYDAIFEATTAEADDSSSLALRRVGLNQRLRQAFIAGAEEDSLRRLGRGLTAHELERVIRGYPGDVADRREPWLSRRASQPGHENLSERTRPQRHEESGMTQTAAPECICGTADEFGRVSGGDCRSLGCDPECEACRGRCEGCDAPATWVYDEVGATLRHEIYLNGASCAPPSIWCDACHDAGESETVPEYWSRIG